MARPKLRRRAPLIATAAVLVSGGIAAAVLVAGSADHHADRRAVVAYENRLFPLMERGGEIVQTQMKPAVAALQRGDADEALIVRQAESWRLVFAELRRDLAALPEPEALRGVGALFDRAMAGYLETADVILAGARSDGSARDSAVRRAIEAGERADDLYDEASARLQRVRRRLGLRPSTRFPDPDG